MSKIIYVNLADLNLPEFQAHTKIPEAQLTEIVESIRDIGIIEPLIITDTKDGFEIVAGCVRYLAALRAGLKAAPCINMSLDPKAAEIIKLHENIKRIPLDHVDQGTTFLMMMEEYDMTEQSISDVTGKSIAYISQHISLVNFCVDLTAEVKQGNISFSQARELMRVDDKSHRDELLRYCKDDGASVQVLHTWVQDFLRKPISISTPDDLPIPSSVDDLPHDLIRQCEACDVNVPISHIRQVFYCPKCHNAIKTAINEEKTKST